VEARDYLDGFGNTITRLVAPEGRLVISKDILVRDPGTPDPAAPDAEQHRVEDLPDDVLVYLMGSRYCDTDRLSDTAWSLFGNAPLGWGRVAAICDYVHDRITFGYEHARSTRTAWDGFQERKGVCRDFAHLAVTFCRCMNIPARYATGYLGDIGVPPADSPMDFSAWFEAYLGGRWAHLRRAAQQAADRPHRDGARARRDGRGDLHHLRPLHARGLRSADGRGGRGRAAPGGVGAARRSLGVGAGPLVRPRAGAARHGGRLRRGRGAAAAAGRHRRQ
jgi:transglutaminase-like putative cysteine protease